MKKHPKRERETCQTFVPIEEKLASTPQGDPIAKVENHKGEENPQEPSQPEPAGEQRTRKKATKPVAKPTVGVQPQASTATYLRLKAKQQKRPGEDSPLAKTSDKPVKSADTSHQKCRQSEGGRKKMTARPQNGVATSGKKNHQGNPSFAIKSDKDTLDPKGDHIPKEYAGEANG